MKNIVFANDLSDNSENSLKYAIMLSKKAKAKLVILHVFDISALLATPLEIPYLPNIDGQILEAQKNKMKEQFLFVAGSDSNEIDVTFDAIEHTSVSRCIAEKSEEFSADLLIMGTNGKKRFEEFLIGNNTKRVITENLCPTLVIPPECEFHLLDKIMFASDFAADNVEALHALVSFAELFDAKINVIHISTDYETFSLNRMNDFKKQISLEINYPKLNFEFLLSNDINERLDEYANENNVNIIAMIEHENKGFFTKIFQRDHVKNMISLTKIPLLCFNQKYLVKRSFSETEAKLKLHS
jgi:nucleotide-binding universal stress UspA family protein